MCLTAFITSLFEAMITFGGSPTGVMAPPIFENIIIHINIGTGFNFITSHNLIVTGVIRSTVVTLSKKHDKNDVKKHKVFINGQIFPLVI